jgi:hypothetical protein
VPRNSSTPIGFRLSSSSLSALDDVRRIVLFRMEQSHLWSVLSICWTGAVPLFRIDKLAELLGRLPVNANREAIFSNVVLAVVLDPSEHSDIDLSFAFKAFLNGKTGFKHAPLRDRVLKEPARLANARIPLLEELLLPESIHDRALQLAHSFTADRASLVEVVVEAILTWGKGRTLLSTEVSHTPLSNQTQPNFESKRRPGRPSEVSDAMREFYGEHKAEFQPLLENLDGRKRVAQEISIKVFCTTGTENPHYKASRFVRNLCQPSKKKNAGEKTR